MNNKKIIIYHSCYGDEHLCLLVNTIKNILDKDYPNDIIEILIEVKK